jgi:hypothetical protein
MNSLEKGLEWKHGFISPEHRNWRHDGEPVRLIICIKNPYAWLVSCYNYFVENYHADGTVDRAFKMSWDFENFVKSPSYDFKSPVDRWNTLLRHWLEFPENMEFTEIVLHESLLDESGQRRELRRIEKNQSLLRRKAKLLGISRRVDTEMRMRDPFNKAYYAKKRYFAYYSNEALEFVNSSIDMDLLNALGYKKAKHVL